MFSLIVSKFPGVAGMGTGRTLTGSLGRGKSRAFLFCHHKEQQCHKMMSKGYNPNGPHLNKKKIVHTEKNLWMFGEFGFRRISLHSLRC